MVVLGLRVIVLLFLITNNLVEGFRHQKHVSINSYYTSRMSKPEDFIDVEIAGDDAQKQKSKLVKDTGKGLFNVVRKTGKNILGIFKKDEAQEKALAQTSGYDKALDELFQGTGLMGVLAKTLIKTASNGLSASFEQTRNDVDRIQSIARRSIQAEGILGGEVECFAPTSQSYSSQSINGVSSKTVYLSFSVQGDEGAGNAEIMAIIDSSNNVAVQRLSVMTNRGIFNINARASSTSGNVIDVEEIS